MLGDSGMPSDIACLWKCLYKRADCCDDDDDLRRKKKKKKNTCKTLFWVFWLKAAD